MSVVRILLTAAGAAALILFLWPLRFRILSIGNATGAILGAALLAQGLVPERIGAWILRAWSGAGRPGLLVLAAALAVILALALLTLTKIIAATRRRPAAGATVVVLGCQVHGDQPSRMLTRRLQRTRDYLLEDPRRVAILSGGKGDNEGISEALCMYRWLVAQGIAPERLYLEDRSTSTEENLLFSWRIIRREGLGREMAIVTNEFHQYRAGYIADYLGFSHGAVCARSVWWLLPTYLIREQYGILFFWALHRRKRRQGLDYLRRETGAAERREKEN